MARYAEKTTIPVEKSKMEIETLLKRYKATDYISGYSGQLATVMFRLNDVVVRFNLFIPPQNDPRFKNQRNRANAAEQEVRRLWRSLLLVIKAKLESVESGVEQFEEAFLGQVVTPNGQTLGQWAKEELREQLKTGKMPGIAALGWKENS